MTMLICNTMPSGGVAFNQMGRYYQNGDWSLFMYGVFTTTIGLVFICATQQCWRLHSSDVMRLYLVSINAKCLQKGVDEYHT